MNWRKFEGDEVCATIAQGEGLALIALVVSIQTVSLMKKTRKESKKRPGCLVPCMMQCGVENTCESEVGCNSHDDCLDKAEYCSNHSRCKPCYLCALDNDDVGNMCPSSSCQTTSRMDPSLFCAFAPPSYPNLLQTHSPLAVTTILSVGGCINGICNLPLL
jgi:hypothetical protein